jgi:hypothetical protein
VSEGARVHAHRNAGTAAKVQVTIGLRTPRDGERTP